MGGVCVQQEQQRVWQPEEQVEGLGLELDTKAQRKEQEQVEVEIQQELASQNSAQGPDARFAQQLESAWGDTSKQQEPQVEKHP